MLFSSVYALVCLIKCNDKDYADIGLGWMLMSVVEIFFYWVIKIIIIN